MCFKSSKDFFVPLSKVIFLKRCFTNLQHINRTLFKRATLWGLLLRGVLLNRCLTNNNCKQLGVYPKFLIFKLLNVSNKDAYQFVKLLHSAINKRNKELQHLSKELSLSVNLLSMQLSTIDFYILTKSIRS